MRIAYVCFWNAFRLDGVAKKILTQSAYWRSAGHTVEIFCLSPQRSDGQASVLDGSIFEFSGPVARLRATRRLAGAARAAGPDVVYLRYDLFLPPIWRLLRSRPVVVELNEQPEEYVLRRSLARSYDRISRSRLLDRADGFVSVAEELVESPWLQELGRPAVVIGNSIDVNDFPVAPVPSNPRARGVFLGGPGLAWHGVDKVRRLAELLPEMDFDVIGPNATDLGGPAPPNLTMHGFLGRGDYEPIVLQADFAVGTLALHRQNIQETAPLKLREYLAYGVPMIVAHRDPDFTREQRWFALQLSNTEANVEENVDDVRAWVESIRGRRIPRAEAVALVDVRVKEEARLDFMERVRTSASSSAEPPSPSAE